MNILPYFCGFDGFIGHDGCWIPARREPPEPKFGMPEIVVHSPPPPPPWWYSLPSWVELMMVVIAVAVGWEATRQLIAFAVRMVVRVMQ